MQGCAWCGARYRFATCFFYLNYRGLLMNPRNMVISLSIFMFTLLLLGAKADAQVVNFCGRHTVTFFPLAAELDYAYQCHRTLCKGPNDSETKQISEYGGGIFQWLVQTNNSNASYSPAQQDAIILQAKTLANNNRPASKFVYDIQFFRDFTVDIGGSEYVIGATITYVRCGPHTSPTGPGSSPKG
jgi:hypothetical protein